MFSMTNFISRTRTVLQNVNCAQAAIIFQGIKTQIRSPFSSQAHSALQVLQKLPSVSPIASSSLVLPPYSKVLFPSSSMCNSLGNFKGFHTSSPCGVNSFLRMHIMGPVIKPPRKKNPLGYNIPYRKGVVLKTVIKKPRKPNSANRKCVLVRLSNGKEMTAYVPGEGHTLQEHNVVLVKSKRLRDTPGVKLTCIRGAYDLGEVVKKVM